MTTITASAPAPMTAAEEWRAHWPKVLSGMIGMSFYAMVNYSFGQFIQPIESEFHWNRADLSVGITIFNVLPVFVGPFVGVLIDRYGGRRIGLPGMVLAALAFGALSFANGSIHQWYLLWFQLAIFGLAIKTTVWSLAISRLFSAGRGLALSVMLCGSAVAQGAAQLVANTLIIHHGWRAAYQGIALGWGGLAIILVALFFYDAPKQANAEGKATNSSAHLPGLSVGEAIRNRQVLSIAASNLMIALIGGGVTVHMMPLLTQTGLDRTTAAQIAATSGIAGIIGKIFTGWLLDRTKHDAIPFLSIIGAAVGYALLLNLFHAKIALVIGMLVMGYSSGAQMQITAYLITRYAGLKNFGKIYATIGSMLMLGASIGPWIAGVIHDRTGSYDALLMIAIPAAVVAAVLMVGLGPYPHFAADRQHP